MKRYKPLFETFLGSFNINRQNINIFVNPKPKEIRELLEMYTSARGILNEDGTLFLWQGYSLHSATIDKLKSDSDFKRLFRGNHDDYEDRNYITVILENDGKLYFGDGEEIENIREEDDVDLSVLVYNTMKKNKWVKFSKDFKV